MSKQPNIFNFFSPNANKKNVANNSKGNVKLKGCEFKAFDLVWAKLDGYPWWPAMVCESPEAKIFRKNQIHVQFFDQPPSRGWVKDSFVKAYDEPDKAGIPTYKDPEWIVAKKECDGTKELSIDDRKQLLVDMLPSDEDMEADDSFGSDKSKENDDGNAPKKSSKDGGPDAKKRRIVLLSDSEASEDEYKPNEKEHDSSDDSASSGVDENNISDIDTPSEPETPVKNGKRKRPGGSGTPSIRTPSANTPRNMNQSISSPRTPKTPAVSEKTKSRLSMFAAKENTETEESKEGDWPHTKLDWLKPNKICDADGKRPDHPEYNPRTLYIPPGFLNSQTPAMRQWWEMKSKHFDTVLFFKMGKFYELFHMDAVLGLQELGLLMMKGENAHSGFPEMSFGRFSARLIDKGYKIARIEQTETPDMMEKRCKTMGRPTKFDKVVKREVCQISSKGTRVTSVMDGEATEVSTSYLLAIVEKQISGPGDKKQFGVAFIDTTIGMFHVGQFEDDRHVSRLRTLMAHYPPVQVLHERNKLSTKTHRLVKSTVLPNLIEGLIPEKEFWTSNKTLTFLSEGTYFRDNDGNMQWPEILQEMKDEGDTLGMTAKADYDLAVSALGAVIWYLMSSCLEEQVLTQRKFSKYVPLDISAAEIIKSTDDVPEFITKKHQMVLDGSTLRNLEVFENTANGGTEGTLMEHLDNCSTPFGKRLLHQWLCAPLCNPNSINSRLDAIDDLKSNSHLLDQISPLLKKLPDLEKMLTRIHSQGLLRKNDHPDTRAIIFDAEKYNKKKVTEFMATINAFKSILDLLKIFRNEKDSIKSSLLKQCLFEEEDGGKFPSMKEALEFFDNAFDHEEAEKIGKIIPSKGVDEEYDNSISLIKDTKDKLDDYLAEQCRFFGIKVSYFGTEKKRFQLEVSESKSKLADDDYELVSQRKGFKRFHTSTTKELLADMLSAEETRDEALKDIARRIFNQFDSNHEKWSTAVKCIAVLDVLISLTMFSQQCNGSRPNIVIPEKEPFIEIRDGRHPCTIKTFSGDDFIPNDVVIGGDNSDSHSPLVIVTGPNMGGKSTLMRQTALICILAQIGCNVPAASCNLTPIDRIFTRLGAWDQIMMGESTFYVELAETSSIIQHSTNHSLVLVDELGRGTATYDGTAIASAVVDSLVKIGCRTLFSTHYHSLVDNFCNNAGVSLGHMACMVEGENEEDPSQETITFLYKFTEGDCPKSYGFNAARLAELPESIIQKGSKKAQELEKINLKRKRFCKLVKGSIDDIDLIKKSILAN